MCQRSFLFVLISVVVVCFISACKETPSKGLKSPAGYAKIIQKQVSSDTSQSYALYLPAEYSTDKDWPVILVFDSHADGTLAVEKFKEAAEMFGYIVAGSNNAGNGVANTSDIAEKLMQDISQNYSIDKKRLYAAGFSGGARIALSYAIESKRIKGVIACSAGIPNTNPAILKGIDIYAIAGFEDFNYKEILDISNIPEVTGVRKCIALFDGGHAWPPSSFIKEAVLWHELKAMKDNIIPKDKTLIKAASDSLIISIDNSLQQKRYLLAEQKAEAAISFFEGLTSEAEFNTKLETIKADAAYKRAAEANVQLTYQEGELQKVYIESFVTEETSWWKKEIETLNNEIKTNNNVLERQMYSRIKGFLGIISYSYVSGTIANNDLEKAEKFISIYEIVEPSNPDCFFYKAVLFDKEGKTAESREALNKSIALGFNDSRKIKSLSAKVLETK
jgi:predicted esterase